MKKPKLENKAEYFKSNEQRRSCCFVQKKVASYLW